MWAPSKGPKIGQGQPPIFKGRPKRPPSKRGGKEEEIVDEIAKETTTQRCVAKAARDGRKHHADAHHHHINASFWETPSRIKIGVPVNVFGNMSAQPHGFRWPIA